MPGTMPAQATLPLCELNYMPDSRDGSLPDAAKAISINEQFQVSRQFWAYCVER